MGNYPFLPDYVYAPKVKFNTDKLEQLKLRQDVTIGKFQKFIIFPTLLLALLSLAVAYLNYKNSHADTRKLQDSISNLEQRINSLEKLPHPKK